MESLPDERPYFYAQYRQEYPVQAGKDYVLLETEGRGHYVGTVLAVRTRSPSWFGEGDEKIYIDGEEKPSLWGTGTEDYFLSAWGLKTMQHALLRHPFVRSVGHRRRAYGCLPLAHSRSARLSTSIKVTLEHWGWISTDENPEAKSHSWNEREDDYSSVAFWYQSGQPSPAPPVPPAGERTLPNLDLVFSATPLVGESQHGDGACGAQTNLDFYPQGQLFYQPQQIENAWVEIPFRVESDSRGGCCWPSPAPKIMGPTRPASTG